MEYSYDRTASDPNLAARFLREVLRNLPSFQEATSSFRQNLQRYLRAAHELDHEDETLMDELADPIVIDKVAALVKHLIEAEKLADFLKKHSPHDPR